MKTPLSRGLKTGGQAGDPGYLNRRDGKREMDYRRLVQDQIDEHKKHPIDLLGNADSEGEYQYLNSLGDTYVRTVKDIDTLFRNRDDRVALLEIGSFLGVVSIALKKAGYDVEGSDIPEFYESSSLRELYEKSDIPFKGVNLRRCQLPYDSGTFDAVIICEVIEHLNFNPLPVLKEINRVLKKGGYIYIGMPNLTHITNRVKLLMGRSINNPIEDLFSQLDRNKNMIVGLHWREYSLGETVQMMENMGFETVKKYYFSGGRTPEMSGLKNLLKTILYTVPSFRPSQVVIGKKTSEAHHDFWLTEANS